MKVLAMDGEHPFAIHSEVPTTSLNPPRPHYCSLFLHVRKDQKIRQMTTKCLSSRKPAGQRTSQIATEALSCMLNHLQQTFVACARRHHLAWWTCLICLHIFLIQQINKVLIRVYL
jgi:hypothetical protein